MIVSELIEMLKNCQQDALVLVLSSEMGFETIETKVLIEVTEDADKRSWSGTYTDNVEKGQGRVAVLLGLKDDIENFEPPLTLPTHEPSSTND